MSLKLYVLKKKIKYKIKRIVYLLYPMNYKTTIWLFGSGRSGTTWVSSIINYKNEYRELFEPFHIRFPEMTSLGFKANSFLDDKTKNIGFRILAKLVLRGRYYKRRIEGGNKFVSAYNNDFLLVKDIFVNLIAYEMCSKNNKIRPILLIRNPFAVVLSIRERKYWEWMTDPREFLLYKNLRQKYLLPFESLILKISEEGSEIEKQFLIWSIINYVPLLQFNAENILVTFYEDWVRDPNKELKKVYDYLGVDTLSMEDISSHHKIYRASKTSTQKEFNLNGWKSKMSTQDFNAGMKILEYFGFDKLYSNFSEPNYDFIEGILSKEKPCLKSL